MLVVIQFHVQMQRRNHQLWRSPVHYLLKFSIRILPHFICVQKLAVVLFCICFSEIHCLASNFDAELIFFLNVFFFKPDWAEDAYRQCVAQVASLYKVWQIYRQRMWNHIQRDSLETPLYQWQRYTDWIKAIRPCPQNAWRGNTSYLSHYSPHRHSLFNVSRLLRPPRKRQVKDCADSRVLMGLGGRPASPSTWALFGQVSFLAFVVLPVVGS